MVILLLSILYMLLMQIQTLPTFPVRYCVENNCTMVKNLTLTVEASYRDYVVKGNPAEHCFDRLTRTWNKNYCASPTQCNENCEIKEVQNLTSEYAVEINKDEISIKLDKDSKEGVRMLFLDETG